MSDVFGFIIFCALLGGFLLTLKSCDEQNHRHSIETIQQCFDATKDVGCFVELRK